MDLTLKLKEPNLELAVASVAQHSLANPFAKEDQLDAEAAVETAQRSEVHLDG